MCYSLSSWMSSGWLSRLYSVYVKQTNAPADIKRRICDLLLYHKLADARGFLRLAEIRSAFIYFLESTALKSFWSACVTFPTQLGFVAKSRLCTLFFFPGEATSCRIYASCRHEKWIAFSCPLSCQHQHMYILTPMPMTICTNINQAKELWTRRACTRH